MARVCLACERMQRQLSVNVDPLLFCWLNQVMQDVMDSQGLLVLQEFVSLECLETLELKVREDYLE